MQVKQLNYKDMKCTNNCHHFYARAVLFLHNTKVVYLNSIIINKREFLITTSNLK